MTEEYKAWTQVKVTSKKENSDTVISVMSMVDSNLMIEDFSDVSLDTCYGDLIDEKILNADKTVVSVSVYIPADASFTDSVAFIKDRLAADGVDAKIEVIGVNEEDWANSWKAFYKPTRIGKHVMVVPAWEKYTPLPDDIIVNMDPGMAFGTGTHETTRLVMELLEKYTKPGMRVLDVGCGSGILAICASKLGAEECAAYDIDPVAVRVAKENIEKSGQKNITCAQSDLLKQVDLSNGKFDIVCANIVADIVIRMSGDIEKYMNNDAILLASGIIIERADDVINAYAELGFYVHEKLTDNGWCAIVFKHK